MEYKKTASHSIDYIDMKLIYMELLDQTKYHTFQSIRRMNFEYNFIVYSNLRALTEAGLIYQHPLFLGERPTKKALKKASGLNLQVKDTSLRALAWALLDYETLDETPESEEECERQLRDFVSKNPKYVHNWHRIKFWSDRNPEVC